MLPQNTLEVKLVDLDERGKDRQWSERHRQGMALSAIYRSMGWTERWEQLQGCATYLEFAITEGGRKMLHKANFCRARMCPMCSWRRSRKIYGHVSAIMDALHEQTPDRRYVLLTLTVRNCAADQLDSTLDKMFAAWKRLTETKEFKQGVDGWYRALEVTVNPDKLTLHPHFHVILCTNSAYWGRNYIKQARWKELWARSMRIDYVPVVDVRRIKGDTARAVAEAAKYTVKPAELLDIPGDSLEEVLRQLDEAIAGRRLVAYGGVMRELHKQLNLDDDIDGDLVGATEPAGADMVVTETYVFNAGFGYYVRD